MAEVLIQGILCKHRDLRKSYVTEDGELIEGEEVLYSKLPQSEQFFRRIEDPFKDEDQLVEIAQTPYDERSSKYTELQKKWVDREETRMTYGNGVYAMINGVITYIPASYWGYINYWTLEHGDKPDYRESDRVFFLLMEFLIFETDVLGITRGKGRRQGASSLGYYFMWWICGRMEEKRGGSISFTDTAAQANFQGMFMRGFKSMLPCFVRDFDSAAENFVRFVKPVERAKKGVIQKRQGLNSYCNYLANSINSYDSGRLSFGCFDETGKYHKMNINTYWSKVSPTLKIGKKKVGFAYMPTTVNPKEQGGEDYKVFWNLSDQNKINPDTKEPFGLNTPNKVVRYFVPATEGYVGCIDKFGQSVIEDPKEPVMGNDGEWITKGSLSTILEERSLKTGEQLMEHQRDFPLDDYDMFAFEIGGCEFDKDRILEQIKNEQSDPSFWRKMRLVQKNWEEKSVYQGQPKIQKTSVNPMDDEKGGWEILEFPNKENHIEEFGDGSFSPLNHSMYIIGVDTTQDRIAENGSRPAAIVFKQSCFVTIDGERIESGMYPVAIWNQPTRMDIHFDDEILKAAIWYGCKVAYEVDRRNDFLRHFRRKGCADFLMWTPRVMMNPVKHKPPEPGMRSGDPFQLVQMLQINKWYVDGDSLIEYNGHVHRIKYLPLLNQLLKYNHNDRTTSDLVVALQMALCGIFGEMKTPVMPAEVIKLWPEYNIKSYF